jgi:hypothetical protein
VLVDVERQRLLFQIPMGITGLHTLHLAELFKVADVCVPVRVGVPENALS